jgi:hypothetical protein
VTVTSEDPGSSDLRIDASPEKRFFISMLIRDIELVPAIIDLVDNSVDGARKLRPDRNYGGLSVEIELSSETFSITDTCGGMDARVAQQYAFRFGRPLAFEGIEESVGQFGVGMKRALFKLGEGFAVSSTTATTQFNMHVTIGDWAASTEPDWSFRFDDVEFAGDFEESEWGTTIVVSPLHSEIASEFDRDHVIGHLRTEIEARHQDALSRGLLISVNDDQLVPNKPLLLVSDDLKPLSKSYEIEENGERVSVKLVAGFIRGERDARDDSAGEEFRDVSDAGWYLYCNGRLVFLADQTELTGWGNGAAAFHPQYRLFRGYVFLWARTVAVLPWNTTKTGVDAESRVFRQVQSEMITALRHVQAVLNRLKTERTGDGPDSERPITLAMAAATLLPAEDVSDSPNFVAPPAPPRPRPDPTHKTIHYDVTIDEFETAAEALSTNFAAEVGRQTFRYFMDAEGLD